MKHRSVRVFLNSLTSRDVSVLQPDSAQHCHRTFIKVPFRITCEHVSLETVCSRAMCAPVLLCKKLVVLARPLRDRCRRRSVPDVPPSMRCLCQTLVLRTSEPVCMHCTPTSCPNAADAGRLERDHAPQSTEPSFPGALTATGAARAARGSGQILLQAAGTADCSPARPPTHPLTRPLARPLTTSPSDLAPSTLGEQTGVYPSTNCIDALLTSSVSNPLVPYIVRIILIPEPSPMPNSLA